MKSFMIAILAIFLMIPAAQATEEKQAPEASSREAIQTRIDTLKQEHFDTVAELEKEREAGALGESEFNRKKWESNRAANVEIRKLMLDIKALEEGATAATADPEKDSESKTDAID